MIKTCPRCLKDFNAVNGAAKYDVICRPKAMKELKYQRGLKRNALKREKKTGIYELKGWKHRIDKAMETRAEYLAQFFHRTGILLSW